MYVNYIHIGISLMYLNKIPTFFNVRPVKFSWIKPFSLNNGNLTAIKRQSVFSYTSITKLLTEFFQKLWENLFFWIVIFTDLVQSHLIIKNQSVKRLILLQYICRNGFWPMKGNFKLQSSCFSHFQNFKKM